MQAIGLPNAHLIEAAEDFGKLCLEQDDLLDHLIPTDQISAVLWDPEERVDEEGFYEYLVIVGRLEISIFSKAKAQSLLEPLSAITRADLVCQESLRILGCRSAIALVPKHVSAVIGHPTQTSSALLLRDRHLPLVLEHPTITALQVSKWIYNPNASKSASSPVDS